jgi:hypothetical protein
MLRFQWLSSTTGETVSISLSIIPVEPANFKGAIWPRTRLDFVSDYRILGQMDDFSSYRASGDLEIPTKPTVNSYPLPPGVMVEEIVDDRVKTTRRDKYGRPITYTTVDEMKQLTFPSDASVINKAIGAYVNQLPDDWVIILLWR